MLVEEDAARYHYKIICLTSKVEDFSWVKKGLADKKGKGTGRWRKALGGAKPLGEVLFKVKDIYVA